MVTLVISMLVLIAGLSFYLMSRNSYATIDDNANLEERGQFAISVISRVLRQASYVPPGPSGGAMVITDQMIDGGDFVLHAGGRRRSGLQWRRVGQW